MPRYVLDTGTCSYIMKRSKTGCSFLEPGLRA